MFSVVVPTAVIRQSAKVRGPLVSIIISFVKYVGTSALLPALGCLPRCIVREETATSDGPRETSSKTSFM